jgi:hypothetical protein
MAAVTEFPSQRLFSESLQERVVLVAGLPIQPETEAP